jgi:hypothetical protein
MVLPSMHLETTSKREKVLAGFAWDILLKKGLASDEIGNKYFQKMSFADAK